MVKHVLLDMSSHCKVVGRTLPTTLQWLDMSSSTRITTHQSLRIQLIQNAPDDGPKRSETCQANKKC